MGFYFLTGEHSNHLTRLLAAPTLSPVADASFPAGGLYDNASNLPAKSSSLVLDWTITADICAVPDPSFEAGIAEWSTVSGTWVQSSTDKYTGTYSLRCTAAGTKRYFFTVRSGEARQLSWAVRGNGAGGEAIVRLYCLETAHYLQANGTWAAAAADLANRTANTFLAGSKTYTVEPVSTTQQDEVTLQIDLVASAADCYFDDIVDSPGVSWMSIHGHNIRPCSAVTLSFSDDNSSWTGAATLTHYPLAFYKTIAMAYHRYWRASVYTPLIAAPWIGELIIGQYSTLTTAPDYPVTIERNELQARTMSPQGHEGVVALGGAEQRRITFGVVWTTDAGYQQVRDLIYRGGRGGLYPMVIVPYDTDPDICIFGRLVAALSVNRTSHNRREGEIEILEMPLPLME